MTDEEIKAEFKLIRELIIKEKNVVPDECVYYTAEQVMQCYPIRKDSLIKYRKSGAIVGKRLGTGQWLYPKSQFVYKPEKK